MNWIYIALGLLVAAAILIVFYIRKSEWGMHRHQLAHELACALTRPWRAVPLMKLFQGITIDKIEDIESGCPSNPRKGQLVTFTVHVPEYGISYWHFEGIYDIEKDLYLEFKPIDATTFNRMSEQIAPVAQ